MALSRSRRAALWLAVGSFALAGCGDEDDDAPEPASSPAAETQPAKQPPEPNKRGTKIVVRGSEFGDMLFDAKKQAIYIFEKDPRGDSACYAECAEAWPPVLTRGKPRAGDGADASLLGTIERRDGTTQVTYADQPLYFYAHERPGEVRCHNVNLNGGLWWVVGPDGKRQP